MLVPFLGTLMLISLATAAASIVTVALMVNNRPLPLPRVCAVLVLLFGSSAAVAYCYGWFSVTLGGPFPALCEDRNASGADLTRTAQEYWPSSQCLRLLRRCSGRAHLHVDQPARLPVGRHCHRPGHCRGGPSSAHPIHL